MGLRQEEVPDPVCSKIKVSVQHVEENNACTIVSLYTVLYIVPVQYNSNKHK